jgi:hypothetical protein
MYDQIIDTTNPSPPKLLVYGEPGVGKTTLAAQAGAFLIDCEGGASSIKGLKRTPTLRTWAEMATWLDRIATEPPEGVSVLAIDTLDWLVAAIERDVLDRDPPDPKKPSRDPMLSTMGSSHGGYFKAREIVVNIVQRNVLPMLNAIHERGLAIVLLAHAGHEKLLTPEGATVKMAAPDLPSYILPIFREWADGVFYATSRNGERVLITTGTNLICAKNRYSMPVEMPLSWASIEGALASFWSNT